MKPWDAYFIHQKQYRISRGGKGIVSNHVQLEGNEDYYHFTGLETRYTIRGVNGNVNHALYSCHTQHECQFCSLATTRQYLRTLDETYFKFYDDAEEVLKNIQQFLKWLPTVEKMSLPKVKKKAILDKCKDLMRDVPSSLDWESMRASQIGLPVKRRNELKGIQRYSQDLLDLKNPD